MTNICLAFIYLGLATVVLNLDCALFSFKALALPVSVLIAWHLYYVGLSLNELLSLPILLDAMQENILIGITVIGLFMFGKECRYEYTCRPR